MPFFPREFILDFLYMNPYPHKTILHSLSNLASLLYDVEGSTQEASAMKDSDGRKEANLQTSIIVRNQLTSASTDYSSNDESYGHMKQEDKIWALCLTLTYNSYDQTSVETLKQILESLISQGFEYWVPCLDYVKETNLLQQCNAESRDQTLKFSTPKFQEEEVSLKTQAKSFKNFSKQIQDSLSSFYHKLKSLSEERQSLQDRLAEIINREEINIINEKYSLQSSIDIKKKKLNQGQTKLANLRQEMFKDMDVQQSLILQKEKLCNALGQPLKILV